MRYRIQETILKNKKEFRPQIKFIFFWFSFLETYDTLKEAEDAIAYYDMVRNKKHILYHKIENVNQYEPPSAIQTKELPEVWYKP
jgi:hypothetical protein